MCGFREERGEYMYAAESLMRVSTILRLHTCRIQHRVGGIYSTGKPLLQQIVAVVQTAVYVHGIIVMVDACRADALFIDHLSP